MSSSLERLPSELIVRIYMLAKNWKLPYASHSLNRTLHESNMPAKLKACFLYDQWHLVRSSYRSYRAINAGRPPDARHQRTVFFLRHRYSHSVQVYVHLRHLLCSTVPDILDTLEEDLLDPTVFLKNGGRIPVDVIHYAYHVQPRDPLEMAAALYNALERGDEEIAEALFQCGADPRTLCELYRFTDKPWALRRLLKWDVAEMTATKCSCGWSTEDRVQSKCRDTRDPAVREHDALQQFPFRGPDAWAQLALSLETVQKTVEPIVRRLPYRYPYYESEQNAEVTLQELDGAMAVLIDELESTSYHHFNSTLMNTVRLCNPSFVRQIETSETATGRHRLCDSRSVAPCEVALYPRKIPVRLKDLRYANIHAQRDVTCMVAEAWLEQRKSDTWTDMKDDSDEADHYDHQVAEFERSAITEDVRRGHVIRRSIYVRDLLALGLSPV